MSKRQIVTPSSLGTAQRTFVLSRRASMNMSHRIGTMRMSSLRNSRSSASLSEVVCQTSLPSLNVVSCSTYSCSVSSDRQQLTTGTHAASRHYYVHRKSASWVGLPASPLTLARSGLGFPTYPVPRCLETRSSVSLVRSHCAQVQVQKLCDKRARFN
jgi:hypothetical protein